MAINVTENEDGTLTIDWDEEEDAIFNDWTAEDFIRLISDYAEKVTAESEYANHISTQIKVNQTAEELQQDINTAQEYLKDPDSHYDEYIQATNQETYGDQGNEQQET